ncbi:MAG TPA: preprotein translocase subunit SecE [Anaerolineales bacterium]|nr:preprotein translocase subunit SecE [Anaerolineales bacterium]HRQ91846.1 preprotein translocase subunit SecE [Anaerolineales bacterium]
MSNQTQVRQPNAIQRLFRETVAELRKVSWPTRAEALALTRIVLIVMIIMAAILGGLDWVFFRFFGWLFGH